MTDALSQATTTPNRKASSDNSPGTTKGSSQLLPTWQFRSNLRGDSLRGSCGRRGSSGLLDLVHTSGRLGHDTGLSCPVLPVFEHFVSTQ